MPAYIPIPEGLELPQEAQFVLPVTFEVRDEQLYALAVDGIPLPESEPQPAPEGEGEQPEMSEEDFMAAVERQMGSAGMR